MSHPKQRRYDDPPSTRREFLWGLLHAAAAVGGLGLAGASVYLRKNTPSVQAPVPPAPVAAPSPAVDNQPSPEVTALTNDLDAKAGLLNQRIAAIITDPSIGDKSRDVTRVINSSYVLSGTMKQIQGRSGDPQQPFGAYGVETYSSPVVTSQGVVPDGTRVGVVTYVSARPVPAEQMFGEGQILSETVIMREPDGTTSLYTIDRNNINSPTEFVYTQVNTGDPTVLTIQTSPFNQPGVPLQTWQVPLPPNFVEQQYQQALTLLGHCSQHPPIPTVEGFTPYATPTLPPMQ